MFRWLNEFGVVCVCVWGLLLKVRLQGVMSLYLFKPGRVQGVRQFDSKSDYSF